MPTFFLLHVPGFVVIQYLPLCLTCYAVPETQYYIVRGKQVENVLPYNTIMDKKKAAEGGELGPKDAWASTGFHLRHMKNRRHGKKLSKNNWDVSLSHAQKVGMGI